MPIYEYNCKKCGHTFDMFRGINSDDRQVECPKCGEKHIKRKFSPFSNINGFNCIPRFNSG
jgi:putative FmdB family regulatory protein